MTVLEGIQKSAEFLAKRRVESPRLQAELLLAHVLKLPRMKLYLNFERALSEPETDAFRELVKRRSQREPLQHIVGSTSFCGLEIAVNRSVLVPRPETEILAEAGWSFLSTLNSQPSTALDYGTGSGCIAIALADKCPTAKILALDVSAEALEIAKQNAARNGVADRIEFVQGNEFAALKSSSRRESAPLSGIIPQRSMSGLTSAATGKELSGTEQFDLIISNPPYIPTAEIETLEPEVRDYDPRAALDGGADGLDFYRMFAAQAQACLRPDGRIMLEFGDGQAEAIRQILEKQNWIVEAIRQDYTQRQRILIARR